MKWYHEGLQNPSSRFESWRACKMAKTKIVPQDIKPYLSFASGETISILNQNLINRLEARPGTEGDYVGVIISGDRKYFSQEYISPCRKNELILKSDLNDVLEHNQNLYYKRNKNSRKHPHHHIVDPKEIEIRLDSIISIDISS